MKLLNPLSTQRLDPSPFNTFNEIRDGPEREVRSSSPVGGALASKLGTDHVSSPDPIPDLYNLQHVANWLEEATKRDMEAEAKVRVSEQSSPVERTTLSGARRPERRRQEQLRSRRGASTFVKEVRGLFGAWEWIYGPRSPLKPAEKLFWYVERFNDALGKIAQESGSLFCKEIGVETAARWMKGEGTTTSVVYKQVINNRKELIAAYRLHQSGEKLGDDEIRRLLASEEKPRTIQLAEEESSPNLEAGAAPLSIAERLLNAPFPAGTVTRNEAQPFSPPRLPHLKSTPGQREYAASRALLGRAFGWIYQLKDDEAPTPAEKHFWYARCFNLALEKVAPEAGKVNGSTFSHWERDERRVDHPARQLVIRTLERLISAYKRYQAGEPLSNDEIRQVREYVNEQLFCPTDLLSTMSDRSASQS